MWVAETPIFEPSPAACCVAVGKNGFKTEQPRRATGTSVWDAGVTSYDLTSLPNA